MKTRLGWLAALAVATAGAGPLTDKSSIDDVLDAMQARGGDLKSFTADVAQTMKDDVHGYDTTFRGKATFQALPGGDARLHLVFDMKQKGKHAAVPSKKEYLLQDGWLTDRDYPTNNETRRQVVQPGQKLNLFQLGKGPFPLPIGQNRQQVHLQFDVTRDPPDKDDPPHTIHLTLTPKPDTDLARQFQTIDFWVDTDQRMPVRIETVDSRGVNDQVTDLTNLKVNPPVNDGDFTLPPATGLRTSEVPFGQ
jgi:outer membrane lipoprotein-sorting protein